MSQSEQAMTCLHGKVLVIGYGNPGRLDDGLGPALAEAVGRLELEHVTAQSSFQLAVEHAEQVARHDVAIFADADVAGPEPFRFDRLESKMDATFSTHSVMPATILGLAHDVLDANTDGYVMGIRGYDFDDFGDDLSPRARENLAAAVQFLASALQSPGSEVGP